MTEATAKDPDLNQILNSGLPNKFILSEKSQLDICLYGKTIAEILRQPTNEGLSPDTISDVDTAYYNAVQTLARLNAAVLQRTSRQSEHESSLQDDGDSGFGNGSPNPRHRQFDR